MPEGKVVKDFIPLRNEQDLVEAHEKIVNQVLNGTIESGKANAVARLLKGSTFLISELPAQKLNLLAKFRMKNITGAEKLLSAFVEGKSS